MCLPLCLNPFDAQPPGSYVTGPCAKLEPGHHLNVSCAGCTLDLLPPAEIQHRLTTRYKWMLFVGDSDVRLLVFYLLQVLASAGHSESFAASEPALWMEDLTDVPRLKQSEWSRRCLLDWVYDASGRVQAAHTAPCRDGYLNMWSSRSYVVLGQDYNLTMPTAADYNAGLRVTYVGTSSIGQSLASFDGLIAHLERTGLRPDFLLVGTNSWYGALVQVMPKFANFMPPNFTGVATAQREDGTMTGDEAALLYAERMERLAELTSPPKAQLSRHAGAAPTRHADLVFATVLGLAPRVSTFDALLEPRLPRGYRVLRRNTTLARIAAQSNASGLKLSSNHAPHLVSHHDLQRLVHGLAAHSHGQGHAPAHEQRGHENVDREPAHARGEEHETPCITPRAQRFTKACAGLLPEHDGAVPERFIEAVFHWCSVSDNDTHALVESTGAHAESSSVRARLHGRTLPKPASPAPPSPPSGFRAWLRRAGFLGRPAPVTHAASTRT